MLIFQGVVVAELTQGFKLLRSWSSFQADGEQVSQVSCTSGWHSDIQKQQRSHKKKSGWLVFSCFFGRRIFVGLSTLEILVSLVYHVFFLGVVVWCVSSMPPLGVGGFSLLLVPKFPPCVRHQGVFNPDIPWNTASNGAGNDQSIKPSMQNDQPMQLMHPKQGFWKMSFDMVSGRYILSNGRFKFLNFIPYWHPGKKNQLTSTWYPLSPTIFFQVEVITRLDSDESSEFFPLWFPKMWILSSQVPIVRKLQPPLQSCKI